MNHLQSIKPVRAAELLRAGAMLVDIRETDEHAREHIPGARPHPLDKVLAEGVAESGGRAIIFHCRSGARTAANVDRLAVAAGDCEAFLLEGGLEAWRKAGLPVNIDHRHPIDIQRQVQIIAGTLVLLGVILGVLLHPAILLLSGFVGAGLVFAGISGFCGMAKVLAFLPWNRPTPNADPVA